MKLVSKEISYELDGQHFIGFYAAPEGKEKRPAVLVFHDWTGRNALVCERAEFFASLGYVAFAVDMYGEAKVGKSVDENKALMTPLMQDRMLLQKRLFAAFDTVKKLADVDTDKISAVGFCFGGLCALDLARSGAEIKGVVSLHGLFTPIENVKPQVKAKILILHGYEDPMATPAQLDGFAKEMTGVDWQAHFYSDTKHAFTNPKANDAALGTVYNARSCERSLNSTKHFLAEVFTP